MSQDSVQKLGALFKPMLDEAIMKLMNHQTVTSQEVLIQLGMLNARLDVLEKLMSQQKKTPARGEKKVAVEVVADTGLELQVRKPAAPAEKFPVNKLVYFREKFKSDPAYRARYVSPEIQALMDSDATIAGKTNDQQRLVAQATFCWGMVKKNLDTVDALDKEFISAKQAHEAANKPPQQVLEANTPEQI